MLVVGLTGSIGMGKSAVAEMFRNAGIGVVDADQEVHDLYDGAAVAPIEAAFPGTTVAGKVDRTKLAAALLANPVSFKTLEEIVHPLVHAAERAFLQQEYKRGAKIAVLESPLLFEVDTANRVDVIVVVSASTETQRERVLARTGMTVEKFEAILVRQLPDAEKRRRADYIIDTDGPLDETNIKVLALIDELTHVRSSVYEENWA